MADESGLGDLFDLTFTKYVTPTVIRIVYILVIVFTALWWIIGAIATFANSIGAGLGFLIFGTLGALIGLLLWRVLLEVTMVIFRIKENTDNLNPGS
ncbi:MAG: DUF4282 domain-containing protein [Acidimicrobiia bacterium]